MARSLCSALRIGSAACALSLGLLAASAGDARADDADVFSPRTVADDSRLSRARDLLRRARTADEGASTDLRAASEIDKRLGALRAQAKAARAAAGVALPQDRDDAVALAEQVEAELALDEAESAERHASAVEGRKRARDLRERALRVMRGEEKAAAVPTRLYPTGRDCRSGRECAADIFEGRM